MLRWLGTVSALAAVVILSMATGYPAIRGSLRVSAGFLKRVVRGRGQVHLAWAMAEPEREGLSRPVLDSLGPMLGSQGTEAFVVVRGGHLVYE